ncbi:MAG TPA: T9SS type A sorting domain-containing protein [Candidatus Kapabacteria bacterium]|nr:T9SS type A sorting domain-containing protein [Candidatus Kapabacteria bacterium]
MRRLILVLLSAFLSTASFGQNGVGMLRLDPSFATSGIYVSPFNSFSDTPVASHVLHFSRITIAGKIQTATPGQIQLGLLRLLSEGSEDLNFGVNGKAVLSWDAIDYANAIEVLDTSVTGKIVGAGASGSSDNPAALIPSIYRINPNGTPDSSFGVNGRTSVRYEDGSGGEFTRIDTARTTYTASGYSIPFSSNGVYGFGAMRFQLSGALDSTFGTNGKAMIAAPIRFAKGFLRKDNSLFFVTIDSQTNEILFCTFDGQGKLVTTFGTNGILHSGVLLKKNTPIYSALHPSSPNFLVVLAQLKDSPSDVPFTLIRFKEDGTRETSFGSQGFVSAPSYLALLEVSDLSLSNDLSPIVVGSTDLGRKVSAVAKFVNKGKIDSSFGQAGFMSIDAGNTTYPNSLISFDAIGHDIQGTRKFIGVGTLNSSGNNNFYVCRYDSLQKNAVMPVSKPNLLIYPNPASSITHILSDNELQSVSVINAIGSTVYVSNKQENVSELDVSTFPDGIYFCRTTTNNGVSNQKLIVSR